MISNPSIQGQLRDRVNNDVWDLVGSGAPTDGAAGTGVPFAGPGSTYTDFANKILYINTNTKASPTWSVLSAGTGDFSAGSLLLPTATSPAQTAEGSAVWDSDDDVLTVGDGASRKTLVGTTATQTLTNKTLTAPVVSSVTDSDQKVLAGNFTAAIGSTGSTLTSLTGMSWTLVAGTYTFEIEGKVIMTTNGGLSMAFKYTTLTATSIQVNSIQQDATTIATTQSTTTTDQTKFIDQKTVAYIYVKMTGSLVVGTGGTLAIQAAQNTAHADTTTVSLGFKGRFVRTS